MRQYSFYYHWYKTDKQKRAHLNRYWRKQNLFDTIECYLCPSRNVWENDPDDLKTWSDIQANCKTKKALLDKYLDLVWECVWEEYSNA